MYKTLKLSAPDGWELKYHSKWIGPHVHDYGKDLEQPIFQRKGTFAANQVHYESVHNIELRSHYNGSGPSAFGGAKQWPVVTSKVAFNEGEYQLAAEFAADLGKFVDGWLKERGR